MINTWNYNDFMVRPYPDFAMETSRGVVLNQGPHQVDIVRVLGGGMVRSVRARTMTWDRSRPGEGAYTCYLDFEEVLPPPFSTGMDFLIQPSFWLDWRDGAAVIRKTRRREKKITRPSSSERAASRAIGREDQDALRNVGLGGGRDARRMGKGHRPGIDPDTKHQPSSTHVGELRKATCANRRII
jgi:predicted dehydrogenase